MPNEVNRYSYKGKSSNSCDAKLGVFLALSGVDFFAFAGPRAFVLVSCVDDDLILVLADDLVCGEALGEVAW